MDTASTLRNLVAQYSRAVDRADWDLLRSCFHPDAVLRYGLVDGGVDDFVEYASTGLAPMRALMHTLGQTYLEIEGDRAFGETYVTAHHRYEGEDGLQDLVVGARYVDRFEARDAGWRIAERTMVYEWTRVDPVDGTFDDPGIVWGRRDRQDPSYRPAAVEPT